MEPCGFVTDESKPRRIEKIHFQANNFRERVTEAYCLLKLAALILFAGAAEITFGQEEERKDDRQDGANPRIEQRWSPSGDRARR